MSSDDEMLMLRNLLLLQTEAINSLTTEFHQQTEAYVQQFGLHPLSQEPFAAFHDARITLRSVLSFSDSCTVSPVIMEATKKHCGGNMAARSVNHLEAFLVICKADVKTAEDRVHAFFVLAVSLAKGDNMLACFESKRGYDLLVEWLALHCSYNDEASKEFTQSLLLVLQHNVPQKSFTTKTVVKNLSQYRKVMKSKNNKTLLQEVLNKYREKINS